MEVGGVGAGGAPVRMRPRMETSDVKGHFLSMYVPGRAVSSGAAAAPGAGWEAAALRLH